MTTAPPYALPTTRELELEALLRQREAQNEEITTELSTLRRHLAQQPVPSTSEPVTLPPALLSLLLPYLADPQSQPGAPLGESAHSVTVAVTQRSKLLQEENDELYNLLKHSETGRLKEEVRGLRRALTKMEGALRESHVVINSLSTELDKCYETISTRPTESYRSTSGPPKPIPTGPRAQKRPRVSQASPSPQQHTRPLPHAHEARHISRSPERGDRYRRDRERGVRRSREREAERDRERERERERDDREYGRRNNGGGRERERRVGRGGNGNGTRGLVERMGL
ncbi:hypothetical protein M422DRAFT_238237 [Sphaerobolus stellatus SS14]|nr:hypothetical protein M422DRAFT_238237 [Sphaerobolus stellatus SS14]